MSKHFMVYYPDAAAAANGDSIFASLKGKFGADRAYQLQGSGAFVVKVQDTENFMSVMDKLGLNEQEKQRGVLVEVDNTNINGWYSNALWDFINQDASPA